MGTLGIFGGCIISAWRSLRIIQEEVLSSARRVSCVIEESLNSIVMILKIDSNLLNSLTEQAKSSPRLRMNHDLRNAGETQSQRMLNAIEPGSPVPIHRHRNSMETVVCIRGRIRQLFYDDNGQIIETVELTPGGEIAALNIPMGQWHTVEVLESGTVIMEFKDGAYEPIQECDLMKLPE